MRINSDAIQNFKEYEGSLIKLCACVDAMIYLVGWMWDTSCRLLRFNSNRVASTLHTHHHQNFLILALAQGNLWVPDRSDAPVAQSLNSSVGHAIAANQIRFIERESELMGLRSELSPHDITGIRLEVVTKFLSPSRWASRFMYLSFCFVCLCDNIR
jgi:hypothetical protein